MVRGRCLKGQYNKEGVIKRAIEEAGVDHREWTIIGIESRQWHTEGVYTDAIPSCDNFLYHKKDGIFAEFPTNINYLKAA